ncbi:hypothetical protein Q9L58_005887 [Maublancomyces gigas]|uniref:Uncharacterized protein n=1 Tax=Discina gigas TaxID=1032678 RepID=A0ABR3GGW5_9PEZI
MDDIGALTVFRVRGRYYSIFDSDIVNCVPSGLGKRFMGEIPSDPDAFEEWKSAKIRHYRAEEARLLNRRKAGMSPTTYGDFWGYSDEPSYMQPSPRGRGWTYIIDLDTDTFTIKRTFMGNRTFPINNIPASMFACISDPFQLMVSAVP